VLSRETEGLKLTFHLSGINNQNFLMRDEETGTYWQQINGVAVSGPLAGRVLKLIPSDELTFALWKTEQPNGRVLADVPTYASKYSPKDWDIKMKKTPTVLSFAQPGLAPRDLMLGIQAFGASRAFPYETVLREKLVKDHIGPEPIILVVGPDNQSVRAFRTHQDFFRTQEAGNFFLMDAATGSKWNFQGCATEGSASGKCLEPVYVIKDYWFDWRNYNPTTTIYTH
jgi:Protein of unknown function (DUF3179)